MEEGGPGSGCKTVKSEDKIECCEVAINCVTCICVCVCVKLEELITACFKG